MCTIHTNDDGSYRYDYNAGLLKLKGHSLESLGQYAFAVGSHDFSPYFNLAMTSVTEVMRSFIDDDSSVWNLLMFSWQISRRPWESMANSRIFYQL